MNWFRIKINAYEAGADALLKALKKQDKLLLYDSEDKFRGYGSTAAGKWLFIPD